MSPKGGINKKAQYPLNTMLGSEVLLISGALDLEYLRIMIYPGDGAQDLPLNSFMFSMYLTYIA